MEKSNSETLSSEIQASKRLNVAVIYGGSSSEHDISKLSAATIISNMSREKYNIIPIFITKEGRWLLYDGAVDDVSNIRWNKLGIPAVLSPDRSHKGFLRIVGGKVNVIPVDIVFPALHGFGGEDGTLQGLLELAGIPYVGSGVLSSAVCMDKTFTKRMAERLGLRQAEYLTFLADEVNDEIFRRIRGEIKYPCFVKPANSGSTIGVSKCANKKDALKAIEAAAAHDRKIIVERAVLGRELETAVLGTGASARVSGVGEIISGGDFYDYEAKYSNPNSKTIIQADIPEESRDEIRESALKIYRALDCSGLARVDFFLESPKNNVIFNEINTMPGFTRISMYPMLWNACGLTTAELIDKLIESGFDGGRKNG